MGIDNCYDNLQIKVRQVRRLENSNIQEDLSQNQLDAVF